MAKKTYQGEGLAVSFDAEICEHAGRCVRGLPQVFDVARRPWIVVDNAPANEVAALIDRCPSGALTYQWPEQASTD
ncbi:MAG: (4Fe-4S)-binding protein [Propionibacteriaceae bacterium]|jgi:uncharacterized Fe-S cluster protein YjdI|nr:(4Fe-4S)-binding protein [Propionibacteriaceae bacterium]